MKVKNVSKKIIGNSQFRLLPGDTMEVTVKEAWVRDYLAEKSIEKVAAKTTKQTVGGETTKKPADKE